MLWKTIVTKASLLVWGLFETDLSGPDKFEGAVNEVFVQVLNEIRLTETFNPVLKNIYASRLFQLLLRKLCAYAVQTIYDAQKPVWEWLKALPVATLPVTTVPA